MHYILVTSGLKLLIKVDMSKLEIRQEIAAIKQKLLNPEIGQLERGDLLIALIALYESAINE